MVETEHVPGALKVRTMRCLYGLELPALFRTSRAQRTLWAIVEQEPRAIDTKVDIRASANSSRASKAGRFVGDWPLCRTSLAGSNT